MKPRNKAFLAAFAQCGNVTEAARLSKTARSSHYSLLEDPEYAIAFSASEEEAVQRLEIECRRRATFGVQETVIYQGRLCFAPAIDVLTGEVIRDPETGLVVYGDKPLTIARPSDNLMMFLLKSLRPQKYRDNASLELSGAGGAPISVSVEFVKAAG